MTKQLQKKRTCYMCFDEATTKEHSPPKSFFPKNYRTNLITVPSCERHNNSNSIDVEYVRNILVNPISTNQVARDHFSDTVFRTVSKSSKVIKKIYNDLEPIVFNGVETAIYTIDLVKFKSVMSAIAFAVYFHLFGSVLLGKWDIICTQLVAKEAIKKGTPDGYEEIRKILASHTFKAVRMPEQDVFALGVFVKKDFEVVFEFIFYGGLKVYAISTPFYYC